jgi:hypothetical protein
MQDLALPQFTHESAFAFLGRRRGLLYVHDAVLYGIFRIKTSPEMMKVEQDQLRM